MESNYIESIIKQFQYYKHLGESTIERLSDEELSYMPNEASNSVAIIVKHLWGNMMSRWTDYLTTDGEKTWRDRDAEFENDINSRNDLLEKWEEGWQCVFNALEITKGEDLEKIVYIRNQGHTIIEVINRQLAHYAYHVGQIVYLGKMLKDQGWESLSVPKNQSNAYNQEKFSQPKKRGHFTDEFLNKE